MLSRASFTAFCHSNHNTTLSLYHVSCLVFQQWSTLYLAFIANLETYRRQPFNFCSAHLKFPQQSIQSHPLDQSSRIRNLSLLGLTILFTMARTNFWDDLTGQVSSIPVLFWLIAHC
jgi:hypothetical protein